MKPEEDSQRMPTIYSRSTIGENTNGRTNFPTFHILHLVEHFYLIPFDPSSFMTDYFYILNILIVSLYRYNLHIISASSPLYSCLVHLPNIRWSSQLLDRQLASVIWQQTCSLLTSLAINRSFIRSQCHFFFDFMGSVKKIDDTMGRLVKYGHFRYYTVPNLILYHRRTTSLSYLPVLLVL